MGEKSRAVPNEEWVLMYRRGLSQTRIARLVGAPVSKVGYHLSVARRLDPSLPIQHEALAPAVAVRVTSGGVQIMDELIYFVKSAGKYPSLAATSNEERKLARWLHRRRRDAATGRLAEPYREGLGALPGWETKNRSADDEARWQEKLAALVSFRASGQDWPRHKKTDTAREHTLGVWLHFQRSKHAAGHLNEAQVAALDTLLPGWRKGRRRGRKPSKPEPNIRYDSGDNA